MQSQVEESLREACATGNIESVQALLSQGVAVNSKNPVNGWTALHWAAKRNHKAIVGLLLQFAADPAIQNNAGELPGHVTENDDIKKTLGVTDDTEVVKKPALPITPNYIANPVFPYNGHHDGQPAVEHPHANAAHANTAHANTAHANTAHANAAHANAAHANTAATQPANVLNVTQHTGSQASSDEPELVLKARVANAVETDFIEIELPLGNLTFNNLVSIMCQELGVNPRLLQKLRKLPNTIIRKDKDVQRLQDYQELELVLTNKAQSEISRSYATNIPQLKEMNIVY